MAKKTTKTAKTPKAAKPAKKKAAPAKATAAPSAPQLASSLGVTLTPPLAVSAIQRLVKAYPGYVAILDDVADQLTADASLLNLKGITAAQLLALQAKQKLLSALEAVTQTVYTSIYQQRLAVDSDAMKALFAVNNRVEAMQGEDPGLAARWSFLSGFLKKFRPGTRKAAEEHAADVADEKAARKLVDGRKPKPEAPQA